MLRVTVAESCVLRWEHCFAIAGGQGRAVKIGSSLRWGHSLLLDKKRILEVVIHQIGKTLSFAYFLSLITKN